MFLRVLYFLNGQWHKEGYINFYHNCQFTPSNLQLTPLQWQLIGHCITSCGGSIQGTITFSSTERAIMRAIYPDLPITRQSLQNFGMFSLLCGHPVCPISPSLSPPVVTQKYLLKIQLIFVCVGGLIYSWWLLYFVSMYLTTKHIIR